MRSRLANSRFNPAPGIADFWNEFRKPNPYRLPILLASSVPFGLIFWWLSGETIYKDPERPSITYITTFDPNRTDAEIIASNESNQEVKDLREAAQEEVAQRKRDLYKALGAAAGMDVEEIDRRGREARAAEAAEREAERDALFGRSAEQEGGDAGAAPQEANSESPAP
ncbi:MAG: hypothetical protein AAGI28_12575 [Pseudomonadota bacterium]